MFVNDEIDLTGRPSTAIATCMEASGCLWKSPPRSSKSPEKNRSNLKFSQTHHRPLLEEDLAMWWTFITTLKTAFTRRFTGFQGSGIESFAASAELVHAPGINLMYGDKKGDIGWWLAAAHPSRPRGYEGGHRQRPRQ